MATYDEIKSATLNLLDRTIKEADHRKQKALHNRLEAVHAHCAAGRLNVVVCGEFKQGKSSLLNAFLSEPDLLKTNLSIATNTVTLITYGEKERIVATVMKDGAETEIEILRKELAEYTSEQGNPLNHKAVRFVQIETPCPKLKSGITLIDTPGVGGEISEHTQITQAFLASADAVIYVSDVARSFTTEDIAFIKSQILPQTKKILFVLSKADLRAEVETVADDNRRKLVDKLKTRSGRDPSGSDFQ